MDDRNGRHSWWGLADEDGRPPMNEEDEDIERVERLGVDKPQFSSIFNAAAVRVLEDMLRHESESDDYRYWNPEWGKPVFGRLCTDNPTEQQADVSLHAMQECMMNVHRNNKEAERLNEAADQLLKEMTQFLETEYGCQE